jgi:hypothetical protein
VNQAAYFGYFGQNLGDWVRDHLEQPQVIVMGRATYVAQAQFSASATDELSVKTKALDSRLILLEHCGVSEEEHNRLGRTSWWLG